MFALSDISKFEGEKEKYKILKPLWDVITDYVVVFLAVVSIVFAGVQVTSGSFECLAAVDCPGISRSNMSGSLLSHIKYRNACKAFYSSQKTNIIKRTDVVTNRKSSFQYTNFVNSECSKSAIPDFLSYFWFVLFIEALVLIILDNLWLKLPNTASVIENFVALVMECYASPFPNFVSTQARSDIHARPHADDQQPDSNSSETARLAAGNSGDQPHDIEIILEDHARRHADDQGRNSNGIEMARLVSGNNGNQPHEFDIISEDLARRHGDDQPRDGNGIEMENPASDNDGDQPYNSNILKDPATISAVKTLYEKVQTFRKNVESSQKIWPLYLLKAIVQALCAITFFIIDLYYMKDLKGTMTCTLTQHIPVAHDYFICSHNLAPTFAWGLRVVYLPTLAFALAIFIFTIVWTSLKRRGKVFIHQFQWDGLLFHPGTAVDFDYSDTTLAYKDLGFLLHLLHSYNKLYVVRFAHFLSKKNKKILPRIFFEEEREQALLEEEPRQG